MTLLDRLTRSAPEEAFPRNTFGSMPFGIGRGAATGQRVTVDSALDLIPVYSAVNLIASAIGSLPCKVYSRSTSRTEASGSRQWRMLHDQPNEDMAADEFWQWVTACLLLWGNAFVYKQRDANGVVTALWPIRPSRVMVGREPSGNNQTRRFFMLDAGGPYYDVDILHIRGLGTDGLVGLSPVQSARQQIANDQAQQEFLGTFLKNGLFSSAVFTHPNRLSKEAQDRLREQISARSGWLSAGEAITLEEGATLQNLTMSLVDSEFVSMAKMSEHRVAQLFGLIPPHTWGATDQGKTMTYQNSEFGGLEFVKWTLRPWLVREESAVRRDQGIFPAPGPGLYPEFDVDALLRADTLNRYQTYQIAINAGIVNAEYVRELENIALPEGSPAPVAALPAAVPDNGEPDGDEPKPQRALEQVREQPVIVFNQAPEQLSLDVLADALRDGLAALADRETRVDVTNNLPEQRQPDPSPIQVDVHVPEQRATPAPVIENHVHVPEQPAPTVNNTVNVPEQPAPVVNNNISVDDEPRDTTVEFKRHPNGTLKGAEITES